MERGGSVAVTPARLSFALCSQTLLMSLQAMLLGIWVLLLLASLTPVCVYIWKRFFTKAVSPSVGMFGAVALYR
jgi:hypothetical protein